jgi:hypothetical protein
VCESICGKQHKDSVYELNRLCRIDNFDMQLSQFVSYCLRQLKKKNWIIVSYSDLGMHHNGYIYQACNFIYTGCTKERTDKYTENGKHSRHYDNSIQGRYRVVRTEKHRYVYFATQSKKTKKMWDNNLQFERLPYPKGENKKYILGEYQKVTIVDTETGEKLTQDRKSEDKSVDLW